MLEAFKAALKESILFQKYKEFCVEIKIESGRSTQIKYSVLCQI